MLFEIAQSLAKDDEWGERNTLDYSMGKIIAAMKSWMRFIRRRLANFTRNGGTHHFVPLLQLIVSPAGLIFVLRTAQAMRSEEEESENEYRFS